MSSQSLACAGLSDRGRIDHGFTAYVWLIHHESPTKVGTYAYVNPVVAVLVGYFLGGEAVSARDHRDAAGAGERGGDHDGARTSRPARQVGDVG